MLTEIADGEIIDKPGMYKISMNWYHQQCCAGPSVSSSGLRIIDKSSLWHFWAQSDLNPDRYPVNTEKAHFTLGSATHCLVLGDEVFDENYYFIPEDAPPRPTKAQIEAFFRDRKWSASAAPRRAYWKKADKEAKGRHLITAEQIEKIKFMSQNISKCPEAVEALTGGMAEICMVWQDALTGVWIKSRPDMIPDNGCDFSDLKTFAPRHDNIKLATQRAITDNRYTMQMALAQMGAEQFGLSAEECILVMVQTTAPYTVTPVKLDAESLYFGRCFCRKAIDQFAEAMKSGHWPMPVEGIMDYTLPDSMLDRFNDMQVNNDLPTLERY